MLGKKIVEFDNSDGTIKTFNRIFERTPLEGNGHVEILGIVDTKNIYTQNALIRNIDINGEIVKHDFSNNVSFNNEDFLANDRVRFKYYARDLNGDVVAKGYNCQEIADQMDCKIGVVKRRLKEKVSNSSNTEHLFNVTRKEL